MSPSLLRKWIIATGAVLSVAGGVTACGGDDGAPPSTDINLTFMEWEIAAEPSNAQAGEIRFEFDNEGELAHNLVVVKSDLPPGELPVTDGVVDKPRLHIIGSAGPIAPGPAPESDRYTVSLTAGKYVLFCDVVVRQGAEVESHYGNGMYTAFLVEP